MIKKIFVVAAMAAMFVSCSSPLERKYSEETAKEDIEDIVDSGELSEEDKRKLVGRVVLLQMRGENLEGMTYQEILDTEL